MRNIKDGPFSWQSKAALWRIREGFDQMTFLDQAIAVYATLTELASDAQGESFTDTRRKIAERSGVSLRRVSEILARFKTLKLLDWKQNFLEGTKELAPSTYTLLSCTLRSRLGREGISGNCTDIKESPQESPEKSLEQKGRFENGRIEP